ncbi:MAG: hypothetical protein ACKO6N_08245 [Myxococcota bacterium]
MFERVRANTAPSVFISLGGGAGLWRMLRPLLLLVLLIGLGVVCAPLWLLNTESGRFVIRAVANSSDDGHLSLRNSQLDLLPVVNLTLEGIRLARPFEPDAPRLRLERMLLEDLSKQSHRPGQPLVCGRARFEGLEALLDQRWVDAQRGQAAPPQLPAAFPRRIEASVVEVVDASYRIRQTLRGHETETRMEGVSLYLQHFQWDLVSMQVTGEGPLTAETLVMNGLAFHQLKIPQLKAESSRVVIPQALVEGLGGTLKFSGEVRFQEGVPTPDLMLEGYGLQLSQVVSSGPGMRQGQPTPEGTVFMQAQVRGQAAEGRGEAPEPVLEGTIQIRGLHLPVKQKSELARKVVERLPGYVPGDVPRLTLGDVSGRFKTAHGRVTLYENQVQQGPLHMVMDGTIEQATGRLNLRLWLDHKTTQEALALLRQEKGLRGLLASLPAPSLPLPPPPGEGIRQVQEKLTEVLPPKPELKPLPTPPPPPEPVVVLQQQVDGRVAAARQALDTKAAQLKAELDAQAARAKADFEARTAGLKEKVEAHTQIVKTQVDTRVEAARADVEHKVSALQARLEPGVQQAQASLEAQRQKLEAAVVAKTVQLVSPQASRSGSVLDALEARYGRPTLCITGTQAAPLIQLCDEK